MSIAFDSVSAVTPPGGIRLVYRTLGQGEPMLMMHGGSGSWRHWVRNLEALAAHFSLVVPDLPGFGDSGDVAPDDITLEAYAEQVAPAVQAMMPPGPFHLVGFSFGGMVGTVLAANLAGRVKRMSLCAPAGFGVPKERRLNRIRRSRSMSAEELREVYRHNLLEAMVHDPGCIDEGTVSEYQANLELARFRNAYLSRGEHTAAYLARCAMPIQVCWGLQDRIDLPAIEARGAECQRVNPRVQVRHFDNAGHWVQFEQAEAVNAWLLDFHRAPDGA